MTPASADPVVWRLSAYLSRMWRANDPDYPNFQPAVRRILHGYARALALDAPSKVCVLIAADGEELEQVTADEGVANSAAGE